MLRRLVRNTYPLVLIGLLWQGVTSVGYVRASFLPPLSGVLVNLAQQMASGDIVAPLVASLYRAATGTAIALVAGVAIGFLFARVRFVKWLLAPLVAMGFPAPKVAFVPIFILWFGIGHVSKIALVAFSCVFPFIVAAHAGAMSVPRPQLWAAQAMGTSQVRMLWAIILPASLPSLLSGLSVAVPYALVSTFTMEMIAGGGGLGGALVYAQRYFDTTTVFAILIVMLAIGYVIDHSLQRLRARLLRWHG